jgi:hypothetical protein
MEEKEYELNIWDKISLWWRHEARYYHKDFINGVKNLIRWFPVIWRDRNWDHRYIWDVMMKKLSFQAEYIRNCGNHVNHIRDAEKMELAVRLMKRVSDEHYEMLHSDYYKSKMHFEPIAKEDLEDMGDEMKKNSADCLTLRIEMIWEKFDEFFAKYPHAYREVTKTDKYIFDNDTKEKIAMNMGYYLHEKANRILFKLLERNIQTWWD